MIRAAEPASLVRASGRVGPDEAGLPGNGAAQVGALPPERQQAGAALVLRQIHEPEAAFRDLYLAFGRRHVALVYEDAVAEASNPGRVHHVERARRGPRNHGAQSAPKPDLERPAPGNNKPARRTSPHVRVRTTGHEDQHRVSGPRRLSHPPDSTLGGRPGGVWHSLQDSLRANSWLSGNAQGDSTEWHIRQLWRWSTGCGTASWVSSLSGGWHMEQCRLAGSISCGIRPPAACSTSSAVGI